VRVRRSQKNVCLSIGSLLVGAGLILLANTQVGVAKNGGNANHPAGPAIRLTALKPYFVTRAAPGRASRAAHAAQGAAAYARGDWAEAAQRFGQALKAKPAPPTDERNALRFMQALCWLEGGDTAQAIPAFEGLKQSYGLLLPYHQQLLARAYLLAGEPARALSEAEAVEAGTPVRDEATLIILEALERLGRWEELAVRARLYLDDERGSLRRAEARFRQAHAFEVLGKTPWETVALYRRIWALAPTEIWASKAEERIALLIEARGLSEAVAAELATPSARDWLKRGRNLHQRHRNNAAEAALQKALDQSSQAAPSEAPNDPDAALSAAELCETHFLLANSIFKQRQRARAAPGFEQAEALCRAVQGDKRKADWIVKSLYQGARCVAAAGNKEEARKKFATIEKEFPQHSYADDARLRAAELWAEEKRSDKSKAMLAEIPTRYPKGDMLGESLFRLAFAAYSEGRFKEARHWLDEDLRLIPHAKPWFAQGRSLYWRARIAQKQGRRAEARADYQEAIETYPLSVYAWLAFERLRVFAPRLRAQLLGQLRQGLKGTRFPVSFGRHPNFAKPEFLRAVELSRLGLGSRARKELRSIRWDSPESPTRLSARGPGRRSKDRDASVPVSQRALWLTAELLNRGGVFSTSHAIPRYTLTDFKSSYPRDANAAAWRLAYPRAFWGLVREHSRINRVPPLLQIALMREESAFNPNIESFANAVGLTQLILPTANRFSEEPVTRESLKDPATNVGIGSRYLAFLLERYNRVIPPSIAGYNAGEGAVDRWLGAFGARPLDEFLERIPYDETRGYTKRVMASFFAYNWLYNSTRPVPRLNFSLRRAKANL